MGDRMRIGLVHPYPFSEVRRGGERYLTDLAAYLGAQGHAVVVLTGSEAGRVRSQEGNVEQRTVAHRRSRLARFGREDTFALSVIGARLHGDVDVVHAFTPQAALAARAAARPVVFTVLGAPNRAWLRTQPRQAFPLLWAAVRSASAVTALTGWAADEVRSCTGRAPTVLPPGVDLESFPVKAQVAPRPPAVLFASDASAPAKRLDVVVDALWHLSERRPDVRLRLGGPGDHRWATDRRATELATRLEVLGVGAPQDLPARYRAAAVTVLASAGEAFGLVLVESLASGTPVVCADAAGPPEIVDDPSVGRRFRPDDPVDLARALDEALELASDPATPGRCARHAARWSWTDRIGPAHEDLYRSVLGTRS